MRKKVNGELDSMVKRGILSSIEWSDWAAPIAPIQKSDGSVRICGDFKVIVNPHLNVNSYPLPTIDSILATMAGSPLSFASRSLSKAEKNCSQIDRGALSIVWAIKKFHICFYSLNHLLS